MAVDETSTETKVESNNIEYIYTPGYGNVSYNKILNCGNYYDPMKKSHVSWKVDEFGRLCFLNDSGIWEPRESIPHPTYSQDYAMDPTRLNWCSGAGYTSTTALDKKEKVQKNDEFPVGLAMLIVMFICLVLMGVGAIVILN